MRKNKTTIIIGLIVIIPVLYIMISDLYIDNYINKKGVYKIVTIEKIEYIGKNANNWLIFKYGSPQYKSGKVYISNDSTEIYKKKIGKKYLAKMSDKEWINKLFTSYKLIVPIPDSIKADPPNGWKELPKWAKDVQK